MPHKGGPNGDGQPKLLNSRDIGRSKQLGQFLVLCCDLGHFPHPPGRFGTDDATFAGKQVILQGFVGVAAPGAAVFRSRPKKTMAKKSFTRGASQRVSSCASSMR